MAVRSNAPSEFGGHQQRNTIAPPTTPAGTPGHTDLPASEKLRLSYLTGQYEDTTRNPDTAHFDGLLPLDEAIEAMPKHTNYFGDDL